VFNQDNLRTQQNSIAFLSRLLLLFQFSLCKESDPLVETRHVDTMAEIKLNCSNSKCRKEYIWTSQPMVPGTKIPAANFLLCFAVLAAGASASKVFQLHRHMGVACIFLSTYFKHQRNILFPPIRIHWKTYQQQTINKLKSLGTTVTIGGDGRHDSIVGA
ncbi:hypothetical protein QZH41_008470, partial [Actinostola sp. cb2023]